MHYYSNNAGFAYLIVLKLRVAFQQNRNDGYLSLSVCVSMCVCAYFFAVFCFVFVTLHTLLPQASVTLLPSVWAAQRMCQHSDKVEVLLATPFNGIYYIYTYRAHYNTLCMMLVWCFVISLNSQLWLFRILTLKCDWGECVFVCCALSLFVRSLARARESGYIYYTL